jgi:hypothetical protein
MKALGYGMAALFLAFVRVAVAGVVGAGRLAALVAVPLLAWCVHKVATRGSRTVRHDWQEPPVNPLQLQLEAADASAGALPAAVMHASDFEVADRIVSIRLQPPVGVINLRVYYAPGLVRRDLIVNEPRLRALLGGRRHSLPDVPYDRVAGLDFVKDETVQAAEKLINELGNCAARAGRRPRDCSDRSQMPAAPPPVPETKGTAGEEQLAAAVAAQASSNVEAPVTTLVAPKLTIGFTYVGKLVRAGFQTRNPKNRPAYEVFEASLQLDNGAELALRGAELERELTANGCAVGERVAITPMGKVPVTLANGSEGQKNLYRARRVDAATRG